MKKACYRITAILLLLSISLLFQSHEYLLISENYFVKKGDQLYVHLFVAQGFNVQLERPLQKSITRNFSLETKDAKTNLLQTTKNDQLSVIDTTVFFEGQALISMERDYSRIELEPEKFAEYLKEDHLDDIIFDASKTTANQWEKYSRYLKCLILSGDETSGDIYKKELNYNLEIILLDNPFEKKEGDELSFIVKFMGKPLANKPVTVRNRAGDENTISAITKTDEHGVASIHLQRSGTWVLHLTHMIPCNDKNDCDWESFWASYSFGVK